MKKYLLPLAAVAMTAVCAQAETVTFDFANNEYGLNRETSNEGAYIEAGTQIENGGVTVTLNKTEGKNGWRLWSDGLRVYKNSDAAISIALPAGCTLESVDFTMAKTKIITAVNGTAVEGKEFIYNGTETNLAFDVQNNGAIASMTINYAEAGAPVLKNPEIAFEAATATATLGEVYVGPAFENPNNLAVNWSSSNEAVATVDAAGNVTLVAAGTTVITAATAANDEYRAGSVSYTLTVADPNAKATSIADAIAKYGDNPNAEFVVDFPLTVAFVNAKNIFATDGKDFIQVYGTNSYQNNDVIPAGWTTKYTVYSTYTPEFMPVGDLPAADGTAEFKPAVVKGSEISNALVNNVVIVPNVTVAAETPATKENFDAVADGVKLTFRNNYTLASVPAGEYDIRVVVMVYAGSPSLYVIEYATAGSTGVAAIEAEGEAAYYDLQGRAVKGNLANGLYIKVQNGKATKVLVK